MKTTTKFQRRSTFLFSAIAAIFCVATFVEPLQAANDGSVDPESIRLAIEDLRETFGDEYPNADAFLAELNELDAEPDSPEKIATLERLQRRALLSNPLLVGRRILAIKRGAGQTATPSLNAYVTEDVPKNIPSEIILIKPIDAVSDVPTTYRTIFRRADGGTIIDTDLEFDGKKLMFTAPGENGRWSLRELDLSQLVETPENLDVETPESQLSPNLDEIDFFDSCYLPDGDVVYGSNATFQGLPCESGRKQMALLYRLNPKTKEIRQLTFEQDSDWQPTMMNNGRVMYLRWEYSDTPHFFSRILFSMNPDGTNQAAYYGTNSYWPNSLFNAKSIPGDETRFVGVVSGHHVGRPGRLILFDTKLGRSEADGVVQSIPGRNDEVIPEIQDYLYQNRFPKFLQVEPLGTSDDDGAGRYFLACADRGAGWGIWLVDVFDNMTPILTDPNAAFTDPIIFEPKERPPVLSERTNPNEDDATVFITDVYFGPGLRDVPRGTIKSLRLFAYHFAYPYSGHNDVVGIESSWDVKRVLGTVPVEADGSATFRIPANTPISIQPLDEKGRAVQLMRSWVVGMQGEAVSCAGCHESQNDVTDNSQRIASRIEARQITPWRGPTRGFDFLREVQPVLDQYCIGCHNGAEESRTKFNIDSNAVFPNFADYSLATVVDGEKRDIGPFYRSYAALRPYVITPGPESDIHLFQPGEYCADVSPLIQLLEKGHFNVRLDAEAFDRLTTWIDLNAPCYGTWTEAHRHWTNKVLLDWMQIDNAKQMASIAKYRELRKIYQEKFANVSDDPEADVVDEAEQYERVEAARKANPTIIPEPEKRPEIDLVLLTPRENAVVLETSEKALERQKSTAPNAEVDKSLELSENVALKFRWVPSGDFSFGSDGESLAEYPKRPVFVERGFYMTETEITNAQFAEFDPQHDSRFIDEMAKDHSRPGIPANLPNQPVSRISFDDARRFCAWLESDWKAKKLISENVEVRLPTEVEWEFAARAGVDADSAFWFGSTSDDFGAFANLADVSLTTLRKGQGAVDFMRKAPFDDQAVAIADVATYKPNVLGFYDLAGNVAEWTDSIWTDVGADVETTQNGVAKLVANDVPGEYGRPRRVVRGGSWRDWPERATASFRVPYQPYRRAADVGFRVILIEKKETRVR